MFASYPSPTPLIVKPLWQDCMSAKPVSSKPLHSIFAAVPGNDASIEFLKHKELIQNIDSRTGEVQRSTLFTFASISNHLSAVKLLLDLGADIDLVDWLAEKTALHHGAELGLLDIVRVLLNYGHPNMLDAHGMTVELLAVEKGHAGFIGLLLQHLDGLEKLSGSKRQLLLSLQLRVLTQHARHHQPVLQPR